LHLSAQAEYGLRCLLQVAERGNGGNLTIPEISRAENLSVPNVAKLMRLLRLGGLVQSTRGVSGGYTLTTSANKVTVAEVLGLLGGPLYSPMFCGSHTGKEEVCTHSADCSLRPVWRNLQLVLTGVLGQITLQDLLCHEDDISRRIADLLGAIPKQRDQPDLPLGTTLRPEGNVPRRTSPVGDHS